MDVISLSGAVTSHLKASLYTAFCRRVCVSLPEFYKALIKIRWSVLLRARDALWWFPDLALYIKPVHIFRGGLVLNM